MSEVPCKVTFPCKSTLKAALGVSRGQTVKFVCSMRICLCRLIWFESFNLVWRVQVSRWGVPHGGAPPVSTQVHFRLMLTLVTCTKVDTGDFYQTHAISQHRTSAGNSVPWSLEL